LYFKDISIFTNALKLESDRLAQIINGKSSRNFIVFEVSLLKTIA